MRHTTKMVTYRYLDISFLRYPSVPTSHYSDMLISIEPNPKPNPNLSNPRNLTLTPLNLTLTPMPNPCPNPNLSNPRNLTLTPKT